MVLMLFHWGLTGFNGFYSCEFHKNTSSTQVLLVLKWFYCLSTGVVLVLINTLKIYGFKFGSTKILDLPNQNGSNWVLQELCWFL